MVRGAIGECPDLILMIEYLGTVAVISIFRRRVRASPYKQFDLII